MWLFNFLLVKPNKTSNDIMGTNKAIIRIYLLVSENSTSFGPRKLAILLEKRKPTNKMIRDIIPSVIMVDLSLLFCSKKIYNLDNEIIFI